MSHIPLTNEKDLLQRLIDGDHAAFEIIYHHYKQQLAVNFIKLLKDDDLATDALQDLFTRVWNNRASIDAKQSFKAYLYRIAKNLVIDFYRKAAHDKTLHDLLLRATDWYSPIEEQLIKKENKEIFDSLLDKLPPQQRRAFELHKLKGKSYKEIADIMGITPTTINKHIYQASQSIKEQVLKSPHLFRVIFIPIILAYL
ncbi:RNA polymerase sigma factor [Sphingobacterium sp. HMA12]|uniref:RNA polymerase sigma factor n=1 Tax=Sphingobacterium sp. HMA12 TaxID=2050894 RepID=UPI000CEA59C5|nr:RNA polymerase sigma factor [Sphingobacterium sp. HMA12]